MTVFDKAIEAWEGSLVGLINGIAPNFESPAPCFVELIMTDGSIKLEAIEAHRPPFDRQDSALLLEPTGKNLITQNIHFGKEVWQKGENVTVFPNKSTAPDGTPRKASTVLWFGSTIDENAQLLKRDVEVEPGKTYTFSAYLKIPQNVRFSDSDKIRFTGNVSGNASRPLSLLNASPDRWQLIEMTVVVSGDDPELPERDEESEAGEGTETEDGGDGENKEGYPTTIVDANQVTLSELSGMYENGLKGALVTFSSEEDSGGDSSGEGTENSGETETKYTVIGNTASDQAANVIVYFQESTLIENGVSPGDRASFYKPEPVTISLDLYSESTASVHLGPFQLEEGEFRTSPIEQQEEIVVRGASTLEYQAHDNPIQNLNTVGLFFHLKYWRGAGNIMKSGNLQVSIDENGHLHVSAGSGSATSQNPLPDKDCKIFIQIASELQQLAIYVNDHLEAKSTIAGWVGEVEPMILTSDGVRSYKSRAIFGETLLDGQPDVGELAGQEILELMQGDIIPASAIASQEPVIALQTTLIPGPEEPAEKSQIVSVDVVNSGVLVEDASLFSIGDRVAIVRNMEFVQNARIQGITSDTLTLDSVTNAEIGDFVAIGEVDEPGTAFLRFPWVAKTSQEILDMDTETDFKLRVGSSLSFEKGRTFVYTKDNQGVGEVLIQEKDDTTGWIVLTRGDDKIQIGHLIGQPYSESQYHPSNYLVRFKNPIDGIRIHQKATNGITISNSNAFAVYSSPQIEIKL